jgi:serine palmitoyltransferase
MDVHLELEEEIASFLGTEAAILYSQGFSAVSSVIPAFSKRGDILVCDEKISFAIQKGVDISRSHVYWFKHNDINDLERVLIEIAKNQKEIKRQFIVVEGLYMNTGFICPLPELIEIKKRYKYRLIVDESCSFGVLGSRGAGVADFFNVSVREVDIICASLCNAISGR